MINQVELAPYKDITVRENFCVVYIVCVDWVVSDVLVSGFGRRRIDALWTYLKHALHDSVMWKKLCSFHKLLRACSLYNVCVSGGVLQ